jgi:hypothetical protein
MKENSNKYFSQIDMLSSFIINDSNKSNKDNNKYIGRNIFNNENNYVLKFYQNRFYYKSNKINFDFDTKSECKNPVGTRNQSICKYLHNTNTI